MTRAAGPVSLAAIWDEGTTAGLAPSVLLDRFAQRRDEASFDAIVARHGPMVRATCRRILPGGAEADVDDAFQATFLVLARRAGSIRDGDRLAPWLHSVARRAAGKVRARVRARRRHEAGAATREADASGVGAAAGDLLAVELRAVLDEELGRLPEKYRVPLILCYLDGLTHDEAAHQLAWPVGTVRSRLAGGRDRLRSRLTRRGFAPGALLALSSPTLPSLAVSPLLRAESVRLALTSAAVARGAAPAAVLVARGVQTAMIFGKTTTYAALALGTCALGTTLGVGSTLVAQTDAPSQKPAPPATTTPAAPATYTDAQLVPYGQFDPAGPRPKVSAEPSLGVQALRRRSRLDSAALKRLRVRNPSLAERSATQIHPQDFNVNLAQILSPDPLFVADVQYQWDLAQLRKEVDEAVAKGTNLSTAPAARSSSPEDDLDAALDRIKTLETELADLKARIARAEGAPGAAIAAPPRAVSPEAPASGGMPYYEPELIPVVPSVPAPPASPADPDTRIIRPTLPSQEVTPPRRYALVEAPNMVVELPSGPLARREMSPLVEPAIPRTPTVRAEAADRPVQRTAPAAPTPPSPPAYPPASEPLALPGTTDRPAASTAEPRPAAPTEKAAPKADSSATLLPGTSKILIAPASHDSVTVFDPKTKSRATYRAPQGTTSLFPIYSAEVVGLSLKGPEVRQVAAFPNQGDHWVVQDLREPAAGPIEPTVMEAALTLRAGRFYYGFSAKANRWAVLELKPAPDGQYPAGVTLGQATIVTEGDTIHIFDFATGEWSTIPTDTATKPGQ